MKNWITIVILCLAVTSCTKKASTYGIDVSHYNSVAWQSVPDSISFCYVKATEGDKFVDPKCKTHVKNARQRGLEVGVYHYYRTHVSPQAQIENFKKIYLNTSTTLIPAIDIEQQGNDFSDFKEVNRHLSEFLDLFEKEFSVKPVIYLGSWCSRKILPTIFFHKKWVRLMEFSKFAWLIPNTVIVQNDYTSIDNQTIDFNIGSDINAIRKE